MKQQEAFVGADDKNICLEYIHNQADNSGFKDFLLQREAEEKEDDE